METKELFKEYYKNLKSIPLEEITEATHRSDLEKLLKTIASEIDDKIIVLHEPKRKDSFGSPDFKISKLGSIIGYVENKKIDKDLNQVIKSEQIKKYKELSSNILITNYIEWVWIKKNIVQRETLCYATDFGNKKHTLDISKINAIKKLISHFFSQPHIGILKPQVLANALAIRSKNLRVFLNEELIRQEIEHQEGKLWGLYNVFRDNVFIELSISDFSDVFAQMLSYGLFLAKLNSDSNTINLKNAKDFIPSCFELIKELVYFLDELEKPEYKNTKWIIEEILSVLNNLDLSSIQKSLSFGNHHLFKEDDYLLSKDAFVYFYEDFLTAYDRKMKKAKGVYYTPPPIVNFIIKAINDILINVFNLKRGLGERGRVTLLDFATGTGTFLVEVFSQILEGLPSSSGKRNLIIKDHLLKNIYGFEYLIAPYTIAHLKLSQYLKENHYPLDEDEKLQIYLTNTLEPIQPQKNLFLPALSREGEAAQKIKDKPILVITGNPPYKGHSINPSKKYIIQKDKNGNNIRKLVKTWIGKLIESYFQVDGQPLKERNPKWLNDDYVKFIRFAQWKMEQVEEGVVGIITNHSFLDNPTFRGMRQSLMNTFNQMYFLDLHGNLKKKEKSPDGSVDENVFDIEPGVCVSILIRKSDIAKKVLIADLWGKRNDKYLQCLKNTIESINWKEIKPESPYYLFNQSNDKLNRNYHEWPNICNIFKLYGNGIVTKRDRLVIDFENNALKNKLKRFKDLNFSDDDLVNQFKIPKVDKDKWNLTKARKHLLDTGILDDLLIKIDYRPFDKRFIYYDDELVARTVKKVFNNFKYENYGLVCGRAGHNVDTSVPWNLAFVVKNIADLNFFSRGGATIFPLYIYEIDDNISNSLFESKREINFSPSFQKYIHSKYQSKIKSEDVIGYIYAILYSPNYREKYKAFLNIDFPSIPFIESLDIFNAISKIGFDLIKKHLLLEIPDLQYGIYKGEGNHEILKQKIFEDKLFINDKQYFDTVTEEVYNFQIGGYRIINKYINYRKGRQLTIDEIENIENIIKVVVYTKEQMQTIDELLSDYI
ncbi:MAG: type ISP restriction/modification enzyme [Promethearchaeota archaeon]